MKRALNVLFFLLVCSAAGPIGGCILWKPPTFRWHGGARRCRIPTQICCSDDGKLAAYAEVEFVDRGLRCFYGTHGLMSGHRASFYMVDLRDCDVSIHIVDVESPGRVASIDLGSRRAFDRIIDLKFSPDGAHLAALDPSRIVLIDVKTGRWRTLCRKSDAKSLAWLSNTELGYVASGLVWRQEVHPEADEARQVFPKGNDGLPFIGWTSWSPDGRYVIVGHFHNRFHVVDLMGIHTFTVTARDPWSWYHRGGEAAWSPDSTSAICSVPASRPSEPERLHPRQAWAPSEPGQLYLPPLLADQVFRVDPSRRQAVLIKEVVGKTKLDLVRIAKTFRQPWSPSRAWNRPIAPSRRSGEIHKKDDYAEFPDYVRGTNAWNMVSGAPPLYSAYSLDGTLGAEISEKRNRFWSVRVMLLKPPISQPTTNSLAK